MKKLFFLLFLLGGLSLNAQYKDLKGLVLHANSYYDADLGSSSKSRCNQLYDISFSDGFLVHNVLTDDGSVDAVQFYKITELTRSVEAGNTYFKFTCISGVSGSSYKYILKVNSAGEATLTLKSSGSETVYTGNTYSIRTYDQNP